MKTLILSYNKFPNGDAGAVRDYVFAKMLNELGHHVCVVAMGDYTNFSTRDYKGIEYISLRNNGSDRKSKLSNYFGYTKKLFSFIENYYSNSLPDIIWIVNIPLHALLSVKKFAIKSKIRLIHDSVEWYSPKQFKCGILSLEFIMKELNNRLIIDKNFRVISISNFLHNYYTNKNIRSLRIPVVLDKHEMSSYKNTYENKLVLLYAGSPGRKDYLNTIIKSLYLLPNSVLNKIEFRIIGVNEIDLTRMLSKDVNLFRKIRFSIKTMGRIPREEVLFHLEKSDFTVLLRDADLRYAKAGFPTKFVESMATGTPIISNLTSDLSDYLIDLENCIIVNNCSSKSFADALIKAYDSKFNDLIMEKMQKCARLTFENNFHYQNYLNDLEAFLENSM